MSDPIVWKSIPNDHPSPPAPGLTKYQIEPIFLTTEFQQRAESNAVTLYLASEVEARDAALQAYRVLWDELTNIANANTRDWDDPTDFKAWAQNRARAALAQAKGKP